MGESLRNETLESVLISAEELFAIHGFNGTSLRDITTAAGVNLAAAHYHLGNKKTLYIEVITRRLRPINTSRLACLMQAEQDAAGEAVRLNRIFDILARPFFELAADTTQGGQYFVRIVGRSLVEPLPFMEDLLSAEFQPAMARFGQALRRHVPHLAPEEFLWRFSFVIGAMLHTLATLHSMKVRTRGICRDHDHVAALQRFIRFAVTAFTAPAKQDTTMT
jgi:AcrR family transcriptional regulator